MPTSTQQRNAVSEGMALGLLLNGRPSIPFVKLRVDLAFGAAWRDWAHRGKFPQVNTDLEKGTDEVRVMTRADESKHTACLYWSTDGGSLDVWARQQDWNPNDAGDVAFAVQVIGSDVPRDGWVALAEAFLRRYDRDL